MPDRRRHPRPAAPPPAAANFGARAGFVAAVVLAAIVLGGMPFWLSSPEPVPPAPEASTATDLVLPAEPEPAAPSRDSDTRVAPDAAGPSSPFSRDLDRALARSLR